MNARIAAAAVFALAVLGGGTGYFVAQQGSDPDRSAAGVAVAGLTCNFQVPQTGGTIDGNCRLNTEVPSSTPSAPPTATSPSATTTVTSTSTTAPSSTSTPSPMPTRTSTATRTPIPPTPSTGTLTIAQVIRDSDETTPHDGAICNTGGYDWQFHSAQQGSQPAGFTQATGWGVLNWDCGRQVAGVTVTVTDFQAWVLAGSTWTRINSQILWCAGMTPQTNAFVTYNCDGFGGLGPTWSMPNSAISIHWASNHPTIPTGTSCGFAAFRASYAGPAGARVMAGAGFDWWQGSTPRSGGVGRYSLLSQTPKWISFSTCDAATLQAHKPPGVQ